MYGGVTYRSRLESQWARFFDAMGWPFVYEPFDLNGWIPDFALQFHEPLLVEVKPALTVEDTLQHRVRIDRSGWNKEALIVGVDLPLLAKTEEYTSHLDRVPVIGLLKEVGFGWAPAGMFWCDGCSQPSILSCTGSFTCRNCGSDYGDSHINTGNEERFVGAWRACKNASQWFSNP